MIISNTREPFTFERGHYLTFNGEDSRVVVPSNPRLVSPSTEITIEYWSRSKVPSEEEEGGGATLWKGGGWDANGYTAWHLFENEIRFEMMDAKGNKPIVDTIVPVGQWVHYAVTWSVDDGIIRTYLNGEFAEVGKPENDERLADFTTIAHNSRPLYLGYNDAEESNPNDRQQWYEGDLTEVRVWNIRRSEQEIAYYKDFRLTGREPGLVYYPDFRVIGSELKDLSLGGGDGSLESVVMDG